MPRPDAACLLIVDDEARILSALRRVLRREGYEIVTAETVEEALAFERETLVPAVDEVEEEKVVSARLTPVPPARSVRTGEVAVEREAVPVRQKVPVWGWVGIVGGDGCRRVLLGVSSDDPWERWWAVAVVTTGRYLTAVAKLVLSR